MSAGYTLGISSYFHDSAAALLQDGDVVAAAQEERFTRKKADASFPQNAIAYCLSHLPAGTAPDQVAYFESPALKADRIVRNAAAQAPRGAAIWPQTRRTLRQLAEELPQELRAICDDPRRIHFVPHHRSHAASAFYPAPFTEAAVLVADGVGEWSTTTLWTGRGTALDPVGEIRFPHSLGLFYSAVTQYCGFKVNSGEYKLMGLAPFGLPEFRAKMQDMLIDVKADGSFSLDMAYFDFATGFSTTSPLFAELFGRPNRHPNDPIDQFYMNMAASAQSVLEEIMVRLSTTLLERTGQRNLCLAGGVALNCVANRALLRDVPGLDALWVQPAAGDAGGALGAALDVAHRNAPTKAKRRFDVLLGPRFDDAEIAEALDAADLVYERPGALAETTAEALAAGQIIGHFDGRMEFGPRALGNRSILADPRSTDALSRVNKSIKFREDWRPFAPMVLAAHAATYFEVPVESPHMLLVSDIKPQYRLAASLAKARSKGKYRPLDLQNMVASQFPAVTHVDFSARLQTIDAGFGSRAYDILAAFHDRTGCPMLLNTSFNVRGEPIVCTPADAVACFLNTHIDVLVIGPFVVRWSAQAPGRKRKAGKMKFDAD